MPIPTLYLKVSGLRKETNPGSCIAKILGWFHYQVIRFNVFVRITYLLNSANSANVFSLDI
ncbi:Uncharacterised protein [Legionella wadsworthii]|uniref:Uncharacterized protein n=1 Tax=Legionella wadsworthii TaxID=28088 RepID=A0A378LRX6_9GAMM|nr:Uncharacterised protein [Legionella wadsworthii]